MLLLGLGPGLVMQVLVFAAQNPLDYRLPRVATSGATLFRQVEGSIGVSVFGAIFMDHLGRELAHRRRRGRPHLPNRSRRGAKAGACGTCRYARRPRGFGARAPNARRIERAGG
jgi:hypothetical protein